MNTFEQVINTNYVALAVALGGPQALRVADQFLRQAIADGAVDDREAIAVLESLSRDEDALLRDQINAICARSGVH